MITRYEFKNIDIYLFTIGKLIRSSNDVFIYFLNKLYFNIFIFIF